MTRRATSWSLGLGASLLANAAAFAGLSAMLAPHEVADQVRPETRLDVQAYAMDRNQAASAAPQTDGLSDVPADGVAVGAGFAPSSQAAPLEAQPEQVATATPPRAQLDGASVAAEAAQPANPTADSVTGAPPDAISAQPAAPVAESARSSAAPPQALNVAQTPGAEILSSEPSFSGLSASAPEAAHLPDSTPNVSAASNLPPPSQSARADGVAPNVLVTTRPAFAVAEAVPSDQEGLPSVQPRPAGLDPAQTEARQIADLPPDAQTLDVIGPTGEPAIVAAATPDLAASSAPALAEAQSARATAQRAAPALGQAAQLVAGTARLNAAPAVTTAVKPAANAAPPVASLPAGAPQTATATEAETAVADAPSSAPKPEDAAQNIAFGARVDSAAPDPTAIRAELAFLGGDGDIDPVSLAAFQSFVPTNAAQTRQDTVRDGLEGILDSVPCSRLQLAFDPETASLRVDGHIPEEALRNTILAELRQNMGADIGVSDNMLILPRPQCGALAGIADIGLPPSVDQSTNPLMIGENLHARVLDFVAGDLIYFDLTAPDYDAHVYVDFFDAEGNVLHISPNDSTPLIFAPADSSFRVGASSPDDEENLRLFVHEPFGQEITVAFAASVPLYDAPRPIIEPAGPYLDWLKARVASARANWPDFKGEWVYFFINTAAE